LSPEGEIFIRQRSGSKHNHPSLFHIKLRGKAILIIVVEVINSRKNIPEENGVFYSFWLKIVAYTLLEIGEMPASIYQTIKC
jgi:hypothetical protein